MQPKLVGSLFSVLTLVGILLVAPAFGQYGMSGMSGSSAMSNSTAMQNSSVTSGMSGMSSQGMKNMTMSATTYDIMAEGKGFKVIVSSTGNLPKAVQFNETQKSISFDVTGLMSQNLVHYEVTVPTKLISGNFTVVLGGMQVKSIAETNDTSTTIHINVPSSFVKENNIGDSSTVTVTGTQAIPEFPINASIIMLIGFATLTAIMMRSRSNLRL